jgi:SnoaL-like domain
MWARPFRAAWDAGDPSVLVAAFAPDIVLRSPLISEPFRGRDEVAALYDVIFDVMKEVEFTDELTSENAHAFIWHAQVGGRPVEGMDLLRPGPGDTIGEITVMCRPLAGAAAFASAAGPPLARRRGAANGVLTASPSRAASPPVVAGRGAAPRGSGRAAAA